MEIEMQIMQLLALAIGQALFMLGLIHTTITIHPASMLMTVMGIVIVLGVFYSISRN